MSVNELEVLKFAYHVFDNYVNHTQDNITDKDKELAQISIACQKLKKINKISRTYSKNYFEERELTKMAVMNALDTAIEMGDTEIAEMAMSLLDSEYSKDLIGTLRGFKEGI